MKRSGFCLPVSTPTSFHRANGTHLKYSPNDAAYILACDILQLDVWPNRHLSERAHVLGERTVQPSVIEHWRANEPMALAVSFRFPP